MKVKNIVYVHYNYTTKLWPKQQQKPFDFMAMQNPLQTVSIVFFKQWPQPLDLNKLIL